MFRYLMLNHQYKNLARHWLTLSKIPGPSDLYRIQNDLNRSAVAINVSSNKFFFSSKKAKVPQQQPQKQTVSENKNVSQSQFLWKLNLILNSFAIGAGFYFPNEAVMFILTQNSLIQVYESFGLITQLKKMTEKGPKYSQQQIANVLGDVKRIFKKIVISLGLLLASSFTMGMSLVYPSFIDYSLLGLNFWILFNLKFANLPHGYYLVLLTLAAFQYLYFQKVFESNKKNQAFQRI